MKKNCIIIGAGLGGLSCGVILAKNGYKVTILEKEHQVGGCLQCFKRKGIKFETGMHFIGSASEGQTLNKLLKYLDISDKITLNQLDPKGYDVISLAGKKYQIANGRENFINQLSEYFPEERRNIAHYYDIIEEISHASSLHSLRHTENNNAINTQYQVRSINDVLDTITENEELKSVLVANLPLYAGEFDKTPFSTHAFITDFYNQSAFRIVGGSDSIADALVKTIENLGGDVKTNQKVDRIVCDETHATGVITKGCNLAADLIISSIHPNRTLELLETKLIRPAYRERILNIRNTVSGFTVFMHFKKDTVPYMNYNYYSYRGNSPWGCEDYNEKDWPKGYLYMHFCHKLSPDYAESGVILSYMTFDEMSPWLDTSVEHRGESYQAFKKRKAEILIDELEKEFPGIKDSIENYYTASPLTYRDYTGTEAGSMYGIAKDIKSSSSRVPHKTRIPNLYLTGQNINSHGMLGVLVGSIVTCSELLTSEIIYQQIIEAN